jgi:hypothetical protein
LGASGRSPVDRRECTTKSGWTARTPLVTVSPKSVDRVIRYWAGSTALDPATNHAVRERRPLPRRADTMARPARVRMRSRKPCTRARRRLLGWKVRLPLATAVTPRSCGGTHQHECRVGTGRLLAPARKPEYPDRSRAATFGRLFEGTDEISLGQTALPGCVRHHIRHTVHACSTPGQDVYRNPPSMLQNGWHPSGNLLASGSAVFRVSGDRQQSGMFTAREPTDVDHCDALRNENMPTIDINTRTTVRLSTACG